MLGLIFQRSFHVTKTSLAASTSVLAKLRKSTGYPLSNCKKALELFPDNVTKAEEWLHAEAKSKGWSKLAKIQTRTATQGLIGTCSKDNVGVMVEVNCETDFVSRNSEFQQLVEKMLSGCMNYAAKLKIQDNIAKEVLEESQLSAIQCENSTLGELVTSAMCKFNEKTIAKRAVFLKVPNDVLLSSVSHPALLCPNGASLGKYGVLLASKNKETDAADDIASLRINICQHIIGMNPLTVGELTEEDIAKFSKKCSDELEASESVHSGQIAESVQSEQNTKTVVCEPDAQPENIDNSDDSQTESQETMALELKESNETQLLFQSYLMDPSITVGEALFKSEVEVLAFERFECGETVEESVNIAVAASA